MRNFDDGEAVSNLLTALDMEQCYLEQTLPSDCRIMSTLVLTTGEEVNIMTAYPVKPDMIAFTGVRNKQSIKMIVRYERIAHVSFHIEKGEPLDIKFFLQRPIAGLRADLRPPE